jgi:transposase
MLADEVDYVIGVDTHRDQHTLAVVAALTGAVLAQTVVSARAHGYADALCFAAKHAVGTRAWAVEGAGHYGAGLSRYLGDRGELVVEVGRHPRNERRLRGKDDPAGRDPSRTRWPRGRDADPAARGTGTGGVAGAAACTAERRRRTSRRARPTPQRDRHGTRAAP